MHIPDKYKHTLFLPWEDLEVLEDLAAAEFHEYLD